MSFKSIAVMIVCLLATATAARAEHKLLITNVLDAKQVEARASLTYSYVRESFHSSASDSGLLISNSTSSEYSLGIGLGYGLEVEASIPYVISDRTKFEMNSMFLTDYYKNDGFGDFSFGATYSLLDEKKGAPVSLVTGVNVKFETAGGKDNPGTRTTDVHPLLAVSKKMGSVTPYASYGAVIRNHGAPDSHMLSVGSEYEINKTFTIDSRVSAAFNTASEVVSSNENYSLELASFIQLFNNFYLIPSVTVATGSGFHLKGEFFNDSSWGSPFGIITGISLYYLY